MSQIFSPGSIAGPAGAPGAAGAAGSLANVKSLTDSVLPQLSNLFNYNAAIPNTTVHADGTLSTQAGFTASPLIYCPGALYAISDLPFRLGGSTFCFAFYDANGNFMSSTTSFAGITLMGGAIIPANTVYPLPGTQTYVRFAVENDIYGGWGGGGPYAPSANFASFYAGVTAPSLPSVFQPFGFDTVASVNTKIAVYDARLTRQLGGVPLGHRNAFNYRDVVLDHSVQPDGTLSAQAGFNTATVYAPASTSMIANIPFYCNPAGPPSICTYDATGNFIAEIGSAFASVMDGGGRYPGNVVVALSGAQTYIKFTYVAAWLGESEGWGGSPASGVFYSGTTADPPPSTLTGLNKSIPFVGNLSATTRTATEIGASADQHTDVTAALNAFLATASALNPIELILDGMFYTTGLVISPNGYTTIRGLGLGTGIQLIPGTPQDAIRIGAYTPAVAFNEGSYSIPLASRTATNIVLRDFSVNPNGQIDAAANQPVSGTVAHPTFGVILTSATNILVDNVNFLQSSNYALTLSNVGFAKVTNCKFTSTGTLHDGIHIDGPSEDIGIMNCDIATGDDGIALNCPEGYGGDISRVTVTNCRFNGSLSVMRVYTSTDPGHMPTNNTHKIRNVVVSNCTGSVRGIAFVIGLWGGGYSSTTSVDQIQDFSVENCTLSAFNGLAGIFNTAGNITFRGIKFIPTSADPVISLGYQVGELVLDDVCILRNPDGNTVPTGLVVLGSGPLGHLSLSNCRVLDQDGSSYASLPYLLDFGGPVSTVRLVEIDLAHVTALVSSGGWTNVTKLLGSGVIGTGTQVPDSVMDNNALYLSSNAGGAPSIKVGGTVKRLTLA